MTGPTPKPWIDAIHAYTPGRSVAAGMANPVKLSSNENPLGTSAAAEAALAEAGGALSRYPDPRSTALREAIGARYDLDPARIICGTGSDEILHLAAGAYAGVGDEVLYVRYGFSVYPIAARRVGAEPVEAPDTDYATDVDALLGAVTDKTRVVFLANPNNPTGTFVPREDIARLHAGLRENVLLVIDQAYAEYLDAADDDGALILAEHASNVLVTRTFSKIYGLAAERIGWGYGPAPVIAALDKIRAPFNVTTAGQRAAIAALDDTDFVEQSRTHNAKWRSWFEEKIAGWGNHGLRAVPSKANFILVEFGGRVTAKQAFEALLERGYITRWLPGQGLPDALRITIGTEDEMTGLVAAMDEILEG